MKSHHLYCQNSKPEATCRLAYLMKESISRHSLYRRAGGVLVVLHYNTTVFSFKLYCEKNLARTIRNVRKIVVYK